MTKTAVSQQPPDIHQAAFRRKAGPAALRAWFNIARRWKLTDAEGAFQ